MTEDGHLQTQEIGFEEVDPTNLFSSDFHAPVLEKWIGVV